MAENPLDDEDMTYFHRYSPWRRHAAREAQPVGGQVQGSPAFAEHLEAGPATAERNARATGGMGYDPLAHPELGAVIAQHHRLYAVLTVLTVTFLATVVVAAMVLRHVGTRPLTLEPMPIAGRYDIPRIACVDPKTKNYTREECDTKH